MALTERQIGKLKIMRNACATAIPALGAVVARLDSYVTVLDDLKDDPTDTSIDRVKAAIQSVVTDLTSAIL